jgi:two-component system phosphate regulon response regulator PhoB
MKKLLIADDEEGVRLLVRMTLDAEAFEILEARDGHEAIALAKEAQPDAVLLDVMMPGPSGLEVCKALRSDSRTAGTTIVMLTAKAQETDREDGLAAGADDYFTKPFSPLGLLRKVEEIFGHAEAS